MKIVYIRNETNFEGEMTANGKMMNRDETTTSQ